MWWISLLGLGSIFFGVLYGIYYIAFRRNKTTILDDRTLPEGEQYEPYCEGILKAIEKMLPVAYEEVTVVSYDGLTLYGKYYELQEGAPLILFFHGYRSSSVRDGNGLFEICRKWGYNILMVDQRAHGKSDGKMMTFGIRERYDVLSWIDWAKEHCGCKKQIVLAGISMGAATVLMASNLNLPATVKGIMADCPYSAPGEILKTVMKSLKMPVRLFYQLAKWSAGLYGGLDLEESSAKEAVRECDIPVLFIHGDDDRFVPCSMSEECYYACASEKRLVFVKGAAHGISYCVDGGLYEMEVVTFLQKVFA